MGDAFDTALFKQTFQRVFGKDGRDEFRTAYSASIEVKVCVVFTEVIAVIGEAILDTLFL